MSGCTSCGNTVYNASGACSSCGGDCGQPKQIVTINSTAPQGIPGRGYDTTSATSIDVLTTGAAGFGPMTIDVEKAYTIGARVRFTDRTQPSVNYFEGLVAAYNPLTGIMSVSDIDLRVGTATLATWDVNLAGEMGENPAFFFEVSQSIDFLDTFVLLDPSISNPIEMGVITINASNAGMNKSYSFGTPVRLTPTSDRGNAGSSIAPAAKIEGFVQAYVPQTGQLFMKVTGVSGVGTHTEWDVDLNWHISTARYLNGIQAPPSTLGTTHGTIIIPGNTIFSTKNIIKINIDGTATASANPMEILYDGVVCFSKVITVPSDFQLEIKITLGYYVTISAKLITTAGTDDHIQILGINNPAYLLSTYKPSFKTQKDITFTLYGSESYAFYSGVGVRL